METPKNFWPPYVGEKFFPNDDSRHLNEIDEQTYAKVLEDNPLLTRRPDLITSSS